MRKYLYEVRMRSKCNVISIHRCSDKMKLEKHVLNELKKGYQMISAIKISDHYTDEGHTDILIQTLYH